MVTLDGNLSVAALPGFSGDEFTIVDNTGGSPVEGHFNSLPEGAVVFLDNRHFRISYVGGDGNDVVLTAFDVGLNDPPVANDDLYVGSRNETLTVSAPGILDNDYDPDGDPLAITEINGGPVSIGVPVVLPSGASLTIAADGSFSYAPPTGFEVQDSFSYGISDGTTQATGFVMINVTNRAPLAQDDSYSVGHDHTLSAGNSPNEAYGLLFNDSDPNGDAFTMVAVNGSSANIGVPITLTSGATLTVNADGSFTYTPVPGFVGQDSFSYTLSDGEDEDTAIVTIDVTNEAPVALDDSYWVLHDQTLTVPGYYQYALLFNDADPDGDALSVTQVNGSSANLGVPITLASGATLTVQSDGSFTYVAPAGFTGPDSFTYTVSDGLADTTATALIDVGNWAPTAVDDSYTTPQDQTLSVPVYLQWELLYNDTDLDNDALTVVGVNGSTSNLGVPLTLASGATLTVHADGSFVYVPPTGFVGQDGFTYTISDGADEAIGTVLIDVLAA